MSRMKHRYIEKCLMQPSVGYPTFRQALFFALGDTINLWPPVKRHPISRCDSAAEGLSGDMARIGIDMNRVIERENERLDISEHERGNFVYGKEAAE